MTAGAKLFARGRPGTRWVFLAALVAGLGALPAPAQEKVPPRSRQQIELSFAPLVKRTAPAVVNIYARKEVARARSPFFDDPFFRRFFGEDFGFGRPSRRIENSLGSGVIVRADGVIVTNNHVIEDADEIIVSLADRREFEAEVMLADERTDLAVLRIDVQDGALPVLELRDSDDLEVGDLVLAIGNPFGVGQTVTSGIVSALARTGLGVSDFQFFIQTDAAINPGNSGGPLISMDGKVVGISTAIFSRSGGSQGVGFAIPSNMVAMVVHGAVTEGKIVRPWLGTSGQAVTAEIAQSLGLERPTGVLINEVYPAGPAERGGLKVGDVVRAVDGRTVDDPPGLVFRIGTRPVGGSVTLSLLRGGETLSVEIDLMPAPEDPPRNVTLLEGSHPIMGATVGNLSPAFAEELGLDTLAQGVVILKIVRGSPAHRLRLRPGDIVMSVNSSRIDTVVELQEALRTARDGWRIGIKRGEQKLNLVVRT